MLTDRPTTPVSPLLARLLIVASLLTAVLLLVLPSTASAIRTMTVDIKAHPSKFKAGKQANLPVFLVENRAPDQDPLSWFKEYPNGVRGFAFDLRSSQSRFVSFTPAPALDYRGRHYYNRTMARTEDGDSGLWLRLYSIKGLKARPDNSGIVGRTEVRIGTLRVAVGPAIKKGKRKIVFDANFLSDGSLGGNGVVNMWTTTNKTDDIMTGGSRNLNGMARKGIRVFNDDSSSAGMAPGDGIKSAPKKLKPGKKARINLRCKTGCQLSPNLKIGKKTVKGLKDHKVKAGSRSTRYGLPKKATAQIKKALRRSGSTKIVLTLTPKSREGSGRAVKIRIR